MLKISIFLSCLYIPIILLSAFFNTQIATNIDSFVYWISCLSIIILILRHIFILPSILIYIIDLLGVVPGVYFSLCCIGVWFIAEKATEKTCEDIYNKFTKLAKVPIGLDPSSETDLVVEGSGPMTVFVDEYPTNDAIIIIHGACGSPRKMINIISYFHSKGRDVFAPLLMYHRRSLAEAANLDYYTMASQLEKDIKYVATRYQKVFCIAHSLGGSLVSYLSIQNRLPNNVYLVLYAPAVEVKIGKLQSLLMGYSSKINKYAMIPADWWRHNLSFGDNFIEYATYKSMVPLLYESSQNIKKMIKDGGQLHNPFICIVIDNDKRVPYKKVINLLSGQNMNIKNTIMSKMTHSPHIKVQYKDKICSAMSESIDTLNQHSP